MQSNEDPAQPKINNEFLKRKTMSNVGKVAEKWESSYIADGNKMA